ncbi:Yip1 family protein [Bacteroides ilei]|uniref:Yip1 family protein n=1 Tax=Bacteroides ilei TaxID=1907658 RepID=UPI0009317E41|nr:Yip1 family protein [Bacteroides ilei]
MNYKDLFQQVWALLSSPGKAWAEISDRGAGREIMPDFVYPLIGLCGLAEFVGAFIGEDISPDVFQIALTRCCALAVALFGGFFLSTYLLYKCSRLLAGTRLPYDALMVLVGYSMVVKLAVDIVSAFVAIDLIGFILQIYTVVIVFEGSRRWLKISDDRVGGFTVAATVAVLLCPFVIEFIFNKFSVILS